MTPELGLYCQGAFQNVSDDSVTLNIFNAGLPRISVDSVCCTTFSHEFRPHVFVSSVLDYAVDRCSTFHQLELSIPTDIFAADRRMAYRFPVHRESGLSVTAKSKYGSSPVTAINLSVQGMLIQFPDSSEPHLAIGDSIGLAMRLRQHDVSVVGIVRHCSHRQYGLSFPSVLSNSNVAPPAALRAIVRAVENSWLRAESSHAASYDGRGFAKTCGAPGADPALVAT
jgi:hypothetical protein